MTKKERPATCANNKSGRPRETGHGIEFEQHWSVFAMLCGKEEQQRANKKQQHESLGGRGAHVPLKTTTEHRCTTYLAVPTTRILTSLVWYQLCFRRRSVSSAKVGASTIPSVSLRRQ